MKKMSPNEIKAKLAVLEELMNMANGAEGDELENHFKGLNKVTVAAKNPEDLEAGLDKAKDLMDEMPEEKMEDKLHEDMEEMKPESEMSLPEKKDDQVEEDIEESPFKSKNLKSKKKSGYLSDLV